MERTHGLPHAGEAAEEPVLPLLAVVDTAVEALQVALDAEILSQDDGGLPPATPVAWAAEVLGAQVEALRTALDVFERALRQRNEPAGRLRAPSHEGS